MKITHIVCSFPPYKGGMGNSVYQFSKILTKQGHEVSVFTPSYSKLTQSQILDEIKIIRLKPWFKFGNAGLIPQLLWKLKNYDIIHLHYPFYGASEIILLSKLLFNKKIKLIIHYHMDSKAEGIKGLIFKFYELLILPILIRQAEIITCASIDYIQHSDISKYYKNHKEKFRKVPFGADLKKFSPACDENIKNNREKIILFVGGLDKPHYFKGLENLLQSIKILKNNFPNIKLNIIGKGNLEPYYKNIAENLKITDNTNFLNNINNEELVKYYNDCDVLVLPSINRGEAFGLVLLEAMACAKPIIASNLPGVRDVFQNKIQGLLVEPNNINDLINKIKIVLQNENLAKQMGRAGRKLVEQKYSWNESGKKLNKIYENLFNK